MTPGRPPRGRRSPAGARTSAFPLSRLRAPWIALLLLLFGAAAARALAVGAGPFLPRAAPAADTVPVFGPRRFESGRGRAALHVERFRAPAASGRAFLLRVTPESAGEVRATVRLNGATVLSAAPLSGGRAAELPVALLADNVVEVSVEGPAGSAVRLALLQAPEATFDVFGPRAFTRGTGAPKAETARFVLPAGAGPPFRLHLVNGEADGSARVSSAVVRLNGVQVIGPSDLSQNVGALLRDVALAAENTVEVELRGAPGGKLTLRVTATDAVPPMLEIAAPAPGTITRLPQIEVAGTVVDATPTRVSVNGVEAERTGEAFRATVPLAAEGENALVVTAVDAAGNRADSVRTVVRDSEAPVLVVSEPEDGAVTAEAEVTVRGTVSDRTAVTVRVGETPAALDTQGAFAVSVPLSEGENVVVVTATDAAGNAASAARSVTRQAGGGGGGLPPDPSTVAPPVDPSTATPLAAATAFLYTGESPIQTGVAPGTILPARVAVVRGRVLRRGGGALPGVTVRVKGRPEYGQTLSRADGWFDLAVNGGEPLTLAYAREGFLPADRRVSPPWQEFAHAGDVALVGLDPAVTTVAFGAGAAAPQVARATVASDADGARRATLLFDAGTEAVLEMPDGTTRPAASLSIRATEYTVGEGGRAAMPAELPATSGYTYAVELSADEAIAAGAPHVRFSRPVAFYLENFPGFPVGTKVPAGWYDREKAAWVPTRDGRVIRVVSVSGGAAQVDADGDGAADAAAALEALGIDAAERGRLASLYAPGQTLWRVEVDHFSWIDLNYPRGAANAPAPRQPPPSGDASEDEPCECEGSVVEAENQVLGEVVPLAGTPFTLHYRSDRVSGRTAARVLDIPVSGDSVSPSLRRILLEVEVAGRIFRDTLLPEPNQRYTFTWDGKDAYGRALQGKQTATVRIGYVYPFQYLVPDGSAQSFGLTCTPDASGSGFYQACAIPATLSSQARQEDTRWQSARVLVGAVGGDLRVAGLGGWTLGVHHAYDPGARILHRGDGKRQSALDVSRTISTVAYVGLNDTTTPGYLDPNGIAVGPDGSVYFASFSGARVWRRHPDGRYTVVAGSGRRGCSGDGGPATEARFQVLNGVALGPDGSVYIEDSFNDRIRRVSPDGIITTFAGDGQCGTPRNPNPPANLGDGGPANRAILNDPYGVEVGPDGTVYIADTQNNRIRKVGADGIIHTIAGTGELGYGGDGGAATQARFWNPWGVTVAPDGSLYISDTGNQRIRRIDGDGVVTTVAGNGEIGFSGDGGPATEARLNDPSDVGFGPDGSLYIPESGSYRLRRVGLDGIITTVAGNGVQCRDRDTDCGDGGPAAAARLGWLYGVEAAPDGSMYIADTGSGRIRRFFPASPGFTADETVIASESGREIYVFTPEGRHLRTRDALSGAVLYTFGYDAAGRLERVTDGDGNVTRVERDGSGAPVAVVGPFGERAVLAVDGAGWLSRVENAAGDAFRLTHTAGGLLTALVDPVGHPHAFDYDALGRLVRDTDPRGGFQALAREETADGYRVRRTTAGGKVTEYEVADLPTGAWSRDVTGPDGLATGAVRGMDERRASTLPDGFRVETSLGGDPRFGMQAPFVRASTVTTPGGLRRTESSTRAVQLMPGSTTALRTRTDRKTVNARTETSVYDAATRRITRTSAAGRVTSALLDSLGRTVELRAPGVEPVHSVYDARGLLAEVRQGSRAWTYTYEGGRLASVRDPLGQVERYLHDAAGRVRTQVRADSTEVGYGYDAMGKLTSLTLPGRAPHRFEFDATGAATRVAAPPVEGDSAALRFVYDVDGAMTRIEHPGGASTVLALDSAGRLSSVTLPTGAVRFVYGAVGTVDSLVAPGATLGMTYDGRLPRSATWSGAVRGTVGWSYDTDLRVSAERVQGAAEVAFGYDADGLLVSAGALTLRRDAASGRFTGSAVGGVSTSLAFDGYGDPTSLGATSSAGAVLQATYVRDALGRVERLTETTDAGTAVWGYGYDVLGRLTSVTRDGAPYAAYEYDGNGNRLRAVGPAGAADAEYDAQDRLARLGDERFGYAPDGALRFRAAGADTTWLEHDAAGQLLAARLPDGTRVEYVLDGAGRRVAKKVNGATVRGWLYGGGLGPVAELDAAGAVVTRFVYATRPGVPDYMVRDGRTYALVADHLGSVRRVVDAATGEVAQAIDYGPWGEVLRDTRPGFQPFGYAGGVADAHTGLLRFGARDYDTRSGRWITKDPTGFSAGSGNLYAYVSGDPVNRVDPSGAVAEVVVFSPSGYGGSSFGHVAVNINGTTYSFGTTGWAKNYRQFLDYLEVNNFRDGTIMRLKLTRGEERMLEKCLQKPRGPYDFLWNNCADPVEGCLEAMNYDLKYNVSPNDLRMRLHEAGLVQYEILISGSKKGFYIPPPWSIF